MIKISKKEYNNLIANLYYRDRELEKEKDEKEQLQLLLKECIEQNIELKKFRDKVILLLNKKGDKLWKNMY